MIDPGRTSFQTFYDRALPAVYSYLHQRLGADEALTMDVTQETFMTIVEQWPLPPDISNPVGYAVGIARHKMVDHLRREERHIRRLKRSRALVRRPAGTSATTVAEVRLHTALATVPPDQRVALLLRYVDDLPVAEVAATINRSVRATESLLARGRRRLQKSYEEAHDA